MAAGAAAGAASAGANERCTVDGIYYDDEYKEYQLAPLEGDWPAGGGTSSLGWRVLLRRILRGEEKDLPPWVFAAPRARHIPQYQKRTEELRRKLPFLIRKRKLEENCVLGQSIA